MLDAVRECVFLLGKVKKLVKNVAIILKDARGDTLTYRLPIPLLCHWAESCPRDIRSRVFCAKTLHEGKDTT